jgi:hypothetical protein
MELQVEIEWQMLSQAFRVLMSGAISIVDQDNHGIGSLALAAEGGQACLDP